MSNRKSRALPALDLLYNLAGRFDAGLGRIVAGEHAGDFQDVFPLREAPDLGNRAAVHFFLINEVMVVGNGRRLWQVGNAEDLALPGELADMVGDLQACLATDADVDFIENHGLARRPFGAGRLQGQGNTRYFAARGDFRQRFGRFAGVC